MPTLVGVKIPEALSTMFPLVTDEIGPPFAQKEKKKQKEKSHLVILLFHAVAFPSSYPLQ